ncbi:MAG: O-antigen ligase family protein [Bacillota bacterium]
MKLTGLKNLFIQPLGALILYMGLVITTLHLEVQLLMSVHLELILFACVLGLTAHHSFVIEKEKLNFAHPLVLPMLLVSLYALAPLMASLMGDDYLAVLSDGEYKSLVKILFLAPCLYYYLRRRENRDVILNSVIFFYVILGLYFLFRYFILNEARAYDDRPLLHIRHGDPNFLCTFFAMIVPLALMQAWNAFARKAKALMVLHLLAALFLVGCAFVTESRMGIIALMVGLGFLMTRKFSQSSQERPVKVLAILVMAALVVVVALQGALSKRFAEINDKSSSDRILTYQNGVKIFLDNPLFGVGIHQAKKTFFQNSSYPHFQSEFNPLEVHNTYLSVAAELGAFGFVAFFALLIWSWVQLRKASVPQRYFLITSYGILVLSALTIGISYKDLVILHLFVLAALGHSEKEVAK